MFKRKLKVSKMVTGTRSKKQKTTTQSVSQPTSPVAHSSATLDALPIVVSGSNPEVTEAVRVMEAEITVMEQLCDRVDSLISKRMDQIQREAERFLHRTADELTKRIVELEQRQRSNNSCIGEVTFERADVDAARQDNSSPHEIEREQEASLVGASAQVNLDQEGRASARNEGVVLPNNSERPAGYPPVLEDAVARLQRRLATLEGELQGERNLRRRAEQQLNDRISSESRLTRGLVEPMFSTRDQPPQSSERSDDPATRSSRAGMREQNVSYIMTRETVPHFKGEAPASEPLKKNQEIESWIRAIENIVRPSTSDSYIRSARASCRGRAEAIINSECFDHIEDWNLFKQELRRKFRGTYSAADFFKVLYDQTMGESQAPMDYFLQIEGSVYQGCRDHREAIGQPSELIRRVFLSGVPFWMRDFLALKENSTAMQLAETAQRLWNNRHGIRHGGSTSNYHSTNNVAEDYPRRQFDAAYPRRGRITAPVAAVETRQAHQTRNVWCEYHRSSGHSTGQCMALGNAQGNRPLICYRCRREGHLSRECSFLPGQGGRVPGPSGIRTPRDTNEQIHTNSTSAGISGECTREAGTTSRGTQY